MKGQEVLFFSLDGKQEGFADANSNNNNQADTAKPLCGVLHRRD